MSFGNGRWEYETPLRPIGSVYGEAAADLAKAISRIEAWGVSIPLTARLRDAIPILEAVAACGEIVADEAAYRLSTGALFTAFDYHDISLGLPLRREKQLRIELEKSMAGAVDYSNSDRHPYQLQSQHCIGAALARSGLQVTRPTLSSRKPTKSPDFVVTPSLTSYGMEVKRPERAGSAAANIDRARDQLEDSGLTGFVVVDATDCFLGIEGSQFEVAVAELFAKLVGHVWLGPPIGHRPGYSSIISLTVVARGLGRTLGADASRIQTLRTAMSVSFAYGRGTLARIHGKEVQDRLQQGFLTLGYTSAEAKVVPTAPTNHAVWEPR